MAFVSSRLILFTFVLFVGLAQSKVYNSYLLCPPNTYIKFYGSDHNMTHMCELCTECHGEQIHPCTLMHDAVCNSTAPMTEFGSTTAGDNILTTVHATRLFACQQNEFLDGNFTCQKCTLCEMMLLPCTSHSDTVCMPRYVHSATVLRDNDIDETTPTDSDCRTDINKLYIIISLTFSCLLK